MCLPCRRRTGWSGGCRLGNRCRRFFRHADEGLELGQQGLQRRFRDVGVERTRVGRELEAEDEVRRRLPAPVRAGTADPGGAGHVAEVLADFGIAGEPVFDEIDHVLQLPFTQHGGHGVDDGGDTGQVVLQVRLAVGEVGLGSAHVLRVDHITVGTVLVAQNAEQFQRGVGQHVHADPRRRGDLDVLAVGAFDLGDPLVEQHGRPTHERVVGVVQVVGLAHFPRGPAGTAAVAGHGAQVTGLLQEFLEGDGQAGGLLHRHIDSLFERSSVVLTSDSRIGECIIAYM